MKRKGETSKAQLERVLYILLQDSVRESGYAVAMFRLRPKGEDYSRAMGAWQHAVIALIGFCARFPEYTEGAKAYTISTWGPEGKMDRLLEYWGRAGM